MKEPVWKAKESALTFGNYTVHFGVDGQFHLYHHSDWIKALECLAAAVTLIEKYSKGEDK